MQSLLNMKKSHMFMLTYHAMNWAKHHGQIHIKMTDIGHFSFDYFKTTNATRNQLYSVIIIIIVLFKPCILIQLCMGVLLRHILGRRKILRKHY